MSAPCEDQPAITIEPSGMSLTYQEFNDQAARFARGLQYLNLAPGDTVVWLMENRLEFAVVAMGAMRGGYDHLALNTHSRPDEISSILTHLRPAAIVVS